MDKRKLLVGLLWDVGLPAGVYYLARALGYDVLPALAGGAIAALLRVAVVGVVHRRMNGLSALVGGTFAVLLVVSLFTGDPRVLLARESILSGVAGVLLVGSCFVGRPLIYTLARRLNAGNAAEWDDRWRTQPSFRRRITKLSAGIGAILLTDAVVRLVLIFVLPVNVMANLSPLLHIGAIAVLLGWGLWYRKRATERAHAR